MQSDNFKNAILGSESPKLNIGAKKQYENAHVPLPLMQLTFIFSLIKI